MSTCETCKYFKSGAGGEGHRAVTLLMAASGGRYYPSHGDVTTMMLTDKHGQCTFNPQGVAKYKSDSCGQYAQ